MGNKKKIGIIGGSGFTGGELIRILLNHPKYDIQFIYSESQKEKKVSEIHKDLLGKTEMIFTNEINLDIDVLFLCIGHGKSKKFLEQNNFNQELVIIDLSSDFRLLNNNKYKSRNFIYGLPELKRKEIQKSKSISNPGCFATAIQLSLIPLLKNNLIKDDVHINAITGSTGAGLLNTDTNNFNWRNNNISVYKPFVHQHLNEVYQTFNIFNNKSKVYFIPNRGNFTRGIFTTIYTSTSENLESIKKIYNRFYSDHYFTHISNSDISLKEVINTNNCHINIKFHDGLILITAAIDNLIKGASGQAVQNLNIIFGYEETLGLEFKGSIY
ncbi:MAG: N-acetyl-gamma-glutamyl-phosphate reductase [Flavobacteriaceae bacterium]|nr:N-acetyl-gamma-glutamyl-phosphate reductase [Flavobacteriaceae bacterium]|tara:strand:+ start:1955 stop:2935 length:981 start_codon:yes stop_codon:yes gene_type:complete